LNEISAPQSRAARRFSIRTPGYFQWNHENGRKVNERGFSHPAPIQKATKTFSSYIFVAVQKGYVNNDHHDYQIFRKASRSNFLSSQKICT